MRAAPPRLRMCLSRSPPSALPRITISLGLPLSRLGSLVVGAFPTSLATNLRPLKSDPQWETWALKDRQVKVWIISSVSSDIQPLIWRKPTSFDMWTVLAKMHGRKKRHLRTYQIKQSIYSLTQGDLSVAFYAALKTKWDELDYHVTDEWKCGSNHSLHWEKEWMDHTFLFLGGLRDEFEPLSSQILNGDENPGIEEVYARVESEEQRRQVMHLTTGSVPSAFVSRASGTGQRPARRCTHCNKLGHSADFCWDLHPEKRLVRGRPPFGSRSPSLSDAGQGTPSSGVKTTKLSPDQLKELQAYIGRLSTTPEESSTVSATVSNEKDSQMEAMVRDENEMVGQMEGVTADARDHLFGQVYVRKEKAIVEDVKYLFPAQLLPHGLLSSCLMDCICMANTQTNLYTFWTFPFQQGIFVLNALLTF
ncbi:hypothetical protein EJ110_NYTH25103 [Nymphaea thermarum]|nr:hypothetical protein EJ110_NYTH25103 [Nymphaea thermarum]